MLHLFIVSLFLQSFQTKNLKENKIGITIPKESLIFVFNFFFFLPSIIFKEVENQLNE